jgi:LPXTG-motif cell wall-anchored protein
MYLQLAEGENDGNYGALAESGGVMEAYVFIPANFLPEFDKDTYVRADYFNKYDPTTAEAILNALAAQQTVGLSVVGAGAVAAAGIKFAKNIVAKRRAKVAAGTAKPIFGAGGIFKGKPGGIIDKIKGSGLIDKIKGGGAQAAAAKDAAAEQAAAAAAPADAAAAMQTKAFPGIDIQGQIGGQNFGVAYDPNNPAATGQQTFFKKNKTLLLIGGAALIGGGIYLATRKKRR